MGVTTFRREPTPLTAEQFVVEKLAWRERYEKIQNKITEDRARREAMFGCPPGEDKRKHYAKKFRVGKALRMKGD